MMRAIQFIVWAVMITSLMLCVAGCAHGPRVDTAPPPPKVIYVDRVVTANCVKASDIPATPPKVGSQMTGDAVHDLDIVASADLQSRAALDQAIALLTGCAL